MFRIRFFIVKNPRLKKIFRQRRWICELRINLNEERHVWQIILATTRCLKITEKSLIASKRATFTFWVDKSWLKMPKMVHFGEFLKTSSLWSMRLTRQFSFNETKNGGKCQNSKVQMRHFGWFSYNVVRAENELTRFSSKDRFVSIVETIQSSDSAQKVRPKSGSRDLQSDWVQFDLGWTERTSR